MSRTNLEKDNERYVLINQMMKHGVLEDKEERELNKELDEIKGSYSYEEFRGYDNTQRQVKVSKGISARRRKIITELLESNLSKDQLRAIEREAYMCISEGIDPKTLPIKLSLKISD